MFYSKPSTVKCAKSGCNDENITVRESESTDVFGYANDLAWWAAERAILLRRMKRRLQS